MQAPPRTQAMRNVPTLVWERKRKAKSGLRCETLMVFKDLSAKIVPVFAGGGQRLERAQRLERRLGLAAGDQLLDRALVALGFARRFGGGGEALLGDGDALLRGIGRVVKPLTVMRGGHHAGRGRLRLGRRDIGGELGDALAKRLFVLDLGAGAALLGAPLTQLKRADAQDPVVARTFRHRRTRRSARRWRRPVARLRRRPA